MARNEFGKVRPVYIFASKNAIVYPANGTAFDKLQAGAMIWIDDWVENVTGYGWKQLLDNYDVLGIQYWQRMLHSMLPVDNDVLYGMIEEVPYLIHTSELGFEGQSALVENPLPIIHRSFEKAIPETAVLEQVA